MNYKVIAEATVEAPSAEAVRTRLFSHMDVTYSNVEVIPNKQWAVRVSVPVLYFFDLTVNAETEDEAMVVAVSEVERIDEIEDFVKKDLAIDYRYEVDALSAEVWKVEPVEDEKAELTA